MSALRYWFLVNSFDLISGCVEGNLHEYHERLATFVAAQGIALVYSTDIAPANGISELTTSRDDWERPPPKSLRFWRMRYETAHELLHHQPHRTETAEHIREAGAEAVGFVVCDTIGLDEGQLTAKTNSRLYNGDFPGTPLVSVPCLESTNANNQGRQFCQARQALCRSYGTVGSSLSMASGIKATTEYNAILSARRIYPG